MPTRLELKPDLKQRQYQYVEPALIGELRHLTMVENVLNYVLDGIYNETDIDSLRMTSHMNVDREKQLSLIRGQLSRLLK